MTKIRFAPQDRQKLAEILMLFFIHSNTQGRFIPSEANPSAIINPLNDFLAKYSYIADCSFGRNGGFSHNPYIIFIRKDTPHIRASKGVYCRVCFHRKEIDSRKIEVSVNQSYQNSYEFLAKDKVQKYIDDSDKTSFFPYPNCDTSDIIDKLEMDLSYFVAIPINELESTDNISHTQIKQIQCKCCGVQRDFSEFYFVDGGLKIYGIENLKFEVCKQCVSAYNARFGTKRLHYLKWQFIACYFAAKIFLQKCRNGDGSKDLLKNITRQISNGYKSYNMGSLSLEKAIQNLLYLFGNNAYGLRNYNESQKFVFDTLKNADSANLMDKINCILDLDYKKII